MGDRNKGKSSSKLQRVAEELDYLVTFNHSITQAMACTMQDLSEGFFINVANLTLARRDSYLDFVKAGIKQDTLTVLRTAPLHMSALFPDHLISREEKEIRHHGNKRSSSKLAGSINRILTGSPVPQLGSNLRDLTGANLHHTLSDQQSHRSSINDNYCVNYVASNPVYAYVNGKETCTANCVTGNKSCISVTRKEKFTGNLDCFVTSKKDTVRTLTVNSCFVVNHALVQK